ncbi:hypothetical protein LEMLEM_LOCUS15849, partial [Lemmus lemmus]
SPSGPDWGTRSLRHRESPRLQKETGWDDEDLELSQFQGRNVLENIIHSEGRAALVVPVNHEESCVSEDTQSTGENF